MMPDVTEEARAVPSFDELYEREAEKLCRVLVLAGAGLHEAQDLTQEAFVRLYERWETGVIRDPAAYLYRTAFNLRRSALRRVARGAAKVLLLRRDEREEPLRAADDRDALRRALARLPRGQREAVVLMEWLDMGDEEAAARLGIRPGAARVRASRGRARLRELLGGEDDG